jgi:tRNA(Ile2) C34 agmatinyltransferase TiaS
MSELIHIEDRGVMKATKHKDSFRCSKCGFMVRKSQIHHKYQEGILEIPI